MKVKRRGLSLAVGFLVIVVLAGYIYVVSGAKRVEAMMWGHLADRGYQQEEIKSVEVYHSFLSPLFSRSRWAIRVRYDDEPGVIYHYTVKDDRIKDDGISGSADKEKLKHKE